MYEHFYLLSPGKSVIEAGHIGHDGSLIGLWGVDDVFVCVLEKEERTKRKKQIKNHDHSMFIPFCQTLPSASSILGMSRCFSAMSKARFKFPSGSS